MESGKSIGCDKRVALVAGVTGVVGVCLAELLLKEGGSESSWKVYGIARRPRPEWLAEYAVNYIRCDLLNKEETEEKVRVLTDVTHLFYVTWTNRSTEEENCKANGRMLQNTLNALLPHAKELKHVCLQTGIKHYVGSHLHFDGNARRLIYNEDLPRLQEPNFYYTQEDILFEAVKQARGRITWSVHRPGLIFGFSPNSLVNVALVLAVYASICKYEKVPLVFTGSKLTWESHLEASDANLVAEQEIWAACKTGSGSKNQAFNISNGDCLSWRQLWPVIARRFGIKEGRYSGQSQSLIELMSRKGQVWDAIVKEYFLYPTKLEDFMLGWSVVDIVFLKLPSGRSSMEKSIRHGFKSSTDTTSSLLHSFDRMRAMNLIPY